MDHMGHHHIHDHAHGHMKKYGHQRLGAAAVVAAGEAWSEVLLASTSATARARKHAMSANRNRVWESI